MANQLEQSKPKGVSLPHIGLALSPFLLAENDVTAIAFSLFATLLENEYPSNALFEQKLSSSLHTRFKGKDLYIPAMAHPLSLLVRRDVSRDAEMDAALDYILTNTSPVGDTEDAFIPTDETSMNTFRFLGCSSEADFIPRVIEENIGLLQFFDASDDQKEECRSAIAFASRAYARGTEAERKSGESYICHPHRMCRYFLTSLLESSRLRQPEKICEDVRTMYFHDILENVPGSYIEQGEKRYLVIPVSGTEREEKFPLSDNQCQTLEALRADTETTYLQKVLGDQSGSAARVKLFDRLDILLTLWYKKDWLGLQRKLVETYTSAFALAWSAEFSGSFLQAFSQYGEMLRDKNYAPILATAFVGLALYEASNAKIMELARKRLEEQGVHLQNRVLDNWFETKVKSNQKNIPFSILPSLFSLRGLAEHFSSERDGQELFGFDHILPFVEKAKETFTQRFSQGVPYLGEQYLYWGTPSSAEHLYAILYDDPRRFTHTLAKVGTIFYRPSRKEKS